MRRASRWIVDLEAKLVHVFTRAPAATGTWPFRKRGEILEPIKLPGIAIGVTDVLAGR